VGGYQFNVNFGKCKIVGMRGSEKTKQMYIFSSAIWIDVIAGNDTGKKYN
jgi:hypothetical protein